MRSSSKHHWISSRRSFSILSSSSTSHLSSCNRKKTRKDTSFSLLIKHLILKASPVIPFITRHDHQSHPIPPRAFHRCGKEGIDLEADPHVAPFVSRCHVELAILHGFFRPTHQFTRLPSTFHPNHSVIVHGYLFISAINTRGLDHSRKRIRSLDREYY